MKQRCSFGLLSTLNQSYKSLGINTDHLTLDLAREVGHFQTAELPFPFGYGSDRPHIGGRGLVLAAWRRHLHHGPSGTHHEECVASSELSQWVRPEAIYA